MVAKSKRFDPEFDGVMFFPMILYVLLIAGLMVGVFVSVTPGAIGKVLADENLRYAITLSVVTSFISTALSLLVALPVGYILSRFRFKGHFFVDTIIDLPIVLPPLIIGLSVLIFFNTDFGRWIDRGIFEEGVFADGVFVYQPLGIVLMQFLIGSAFAVRSIKAGFDGLSSQLEEVAMTLGANRWQTFLKIVLPNIKPAIVAGAVISWARIFGLFGPVLLVCGTMRGKTEIMPTSIFLEISVGRVEIALVLGAMMIVMSTAVLVVFKKLGGKVYL